MLEEVIHKMMKMKKIMFVIFCGIMFVISAICGMIVVEANTTKSVSGFYTSEVPAGIAYNGTMQLSINGYPTYNIYEDGGKNLYMYRLHVDDVIFSHSHGANGKFSVTPTEYITADYINDTLVSPTTKLIYISACNTALSDTLEDNVCYALMNKGVDTVVGFKDYLWASTDTNGIHRFNSIVVYKLTQGYTIINAMESAVEQIIEEDEITWGADSYTIYGNATLKLCN